MQATEELVARAKSGDGEAMGTLVERYERVTVGIAWSILRDFHLAQDVAQDAFLEAFKQIRQLRTNRLFAIWLIQITRRIAFRRKKVRLEQTVSMDWNTVPEIKLWGDPIQDIVPMLANLPVHEYEVVGLRYFNGLSVEQVAIETGRSVGTVTKQISRAIKRLQSMREAVDP